MDSFTIFTWTLTATTILGTYLNSKQNKYGFLVWGLCNMLWFGVDFTRGIYAQAALYCIFIGFNVYGWMQWGKKNKPVKLFKDYLWFYFYCKSDMLNFIETNRIESYEHRPPGCDLNDSGNHLLIIPNERL